MVGHAGDDAEIGRAATGDDEVIELGAARLAVVVFGFDFVRVEIDDAHFLGAAADAGEQFAERHDDVERAERGADGVGEQRAEDEVILAVEQEDFSGVGAEVLAQGLRALHAGETAAEDEDASGHGGRGGDGV